MSKAVQALLSGMFFTFILDFFLFLGIKENYIDKLEINLYYNILFADNQSLFLFLFFSVLIGYVTLYLNNKISLIVVGALFLLVSATLIPPIGFSVGEAMFMQKNKTIYTQRFSYTGDIYYIGRKEIYIHDYKLDRTLKIEKNKIKELH